MPAFKLDIEIPPEQRTPLVERLLSIIDELVEKKREQARRIEALEREVNRLRGLPETPVRAPVQPSSLERPTPPPRSGKPARRRKRKRRPPGKRAKFQGVRIDRTVILEPDAVPAGATRAGYKSFLQYELEIHSEVIRYRRACYRLPNGTLLVAPRPPHLRGQFGPGLRCHVLHQYYHNQVTRPLLLEDLREFGVNISSGGLDGLLTQGLDQFHEEKDGLLPAGAAVSDYLQTDDTGGRHQGENCHTLYIGNELFASFVTSESKSRINFLRTLLASSTTHLLAGDALYYMEHYGLPAKLLRRIEHAHQKQGDRRYTDAQAWERQLNRWGVESPEHRRIMTEAVLFNTLLIDTQIHQLSIVSDDAGQFKVLGMELQLCWMHAERHVARLVPTTPSQRTAYDRERRAIWKYYQRLKAYRQTPTAARRVRLERDFDTLFRSRRTSYPDLNAALQKIHDRKEQLLLVLEHPELPLHNNGGEGDIRSFVRVKKVSGGTRSDLGRRCRDTFASLKKTCRKLAVSFRGYLQDRIYGIGQIPTLPEIIRQKASETITT